MRVYTYTSDVFTLFKEKTRVIENRVEVNKRYYLHQVRLTMIMIGFILRTPFFGAETCFELLVKIPRELVDYVTTRGEVLVIHWGCLLTEGGEK